MYAIQVDESTDIGGKAQLLAFTRYIGDGKIVEEFLCCQELVQTTTGKDIYTTLSNYLESAGLSGKF
jgi:hypothetical protein